MVNFQELQAHLKNKLLTDSSYRERWDDSEIKFTEEGFEFTSANGVSFNVSKTGITDAPRFRRPSFVNLSTISHSI